MEVRRRVRPRHAQWARVHGVAERRAARRGVARWSDVDGDGRGGQGTVHFRRAEDRERRSSMTTCVSTCVNRTVCVRIWLTSYVGAKVRERGAWKESSGVVLFSSGRHNCCRYMRVSECTNMNVLYISTLSESVLRVVVFSRSRSLPQRNPTPSRRWTRCRRPTNRNRLYLL